MSASTRIDRVGEEKIMKCGLKAKVLNYRKSKDIDVVFEDGYVAKSKSYSAFIEGKIGHPEHKTPRPNGSSHAFSKAAARLGEKGEMANGLIGEIIRYENNKDIDVRFSNGAVTEHTRYSVFKKGRVPLPERCLRREKVEKRHVGERRMMNCGEWCEITSYRSNLDIDVRFDSGAMREGVSYTNFIRGGVSPYLNSSKYGKRMGEVFLSSEGEPAKIVEYKNATNVSIMFTDGTIKKGLHYSSLQKSEFTRFEPRKRKEYNGFTGLEVAFALSDGRVFYYAVSPEGIPGIWTILQMKELL